MPEQPGFKVLSNLGHQTKSNTLRGGKKEKREKWERRRESP